MKGLIVLAVVVLILFSGVSYSCKEKELPVIKTSSITEITTISASSGGEVTNDGGSEIIAKGVCWGGYENPTTFDKKTNEGSGPEQFVSSITGLEPGASYHVRAYATNSVGTGYGRDILFSTLGQIPDAQTLPATSIRATSALLNAMVNPNNLSTTITFEYGLTEGYGQTVSGNPSPITAPNVVYSTATISGLTSGTLYHYRVVAINSMGTTKANDMVFTTL